jgi:pimeloyl-ACP methyl ester carboxylesterase
VADQQRYRAAERALWESVGIQPRERELVLAKSGATIRVQEVGDGQPVVFVHGASNAGSSWAPLATRLDGCRCILVDRPGCGLSPRLAFPLTNMEEFAEFADNFTADILDAMGVASASIVGTSFGGYFAVRAAAARPDRIANLIVIGWTFGAPVIATPLVMRIANAPGVGRLMTKLPVNERMARSLLKQIGLRRAVESGKFTPVMLAWFVSLLRDTNSMRNEIDTNPRLMTMRGFVEETRLPASLLGAITTPAYLLWGEEDPLGGAEIAEKFAAQIPGAKLEMLSAMGHAPWMDDPELIAARINAILPR